MNYLISRHHNAMNVAEEEGIFIDEQYIDFKYVRDKLKSGDTVVGCLESSDIDEIKFSGAIYIHFPQEMKNKL